MNEKIWIESDSTEEFKKIEIHETFFSVILEVRKEKPSSFSFMVYLCTGSMSFPEGESFRTYDGFDDKGASTSGCSLEKAACFMAGSLKWDGCINFWFPSQGGTQFHFCGREDAAVVGIIINRLYDFGSENLKNWQGE